MTALVGAMSTMNELFGAVSHLAGACCRVPRCSSSGATGNDLITSSSPHESSSSCHFQPQTPHFSPDAASPCCSRREKRTRRAHLWHRGTRSAIVYGLLG